MMAAGFQVITGTEALLAAVRTLCSESTDIRMCYAWAESDFGRAAHWRALELGKVRMAVIGAAFAHTEPFVLRTMAKTGRLRVIEDAPVLFHPKLIVGISGDFAQAIVGSSNFTTAGFSSNTETNVWLRGAVDAPPMSDLMEFVTRQWLRPEAILPDEAWLQAYSAAYGRRPTPYSPTIKPGKHRPVGRALGVNLNVGWSEYYELIMSQHGRREPSGNELHVVGPDSWLAEAQACREVFQSHDSFAEMPWEKRSIVAGIQGAAGGQSSGYFGRLNVAGGFLTLARDKLETIAAFLDAIPLSGDVPDAQTRRYLAGMTALGHVGMGVATRLLAVRRPDRFPPVNNKNSKGIRRLLLDKPINAERYLEVLDTIWSFPWWNSAEPDGIDERRIWRARVALLDALVYNMGAELPGPVASATVETKELCRQITGRGRKRAIAVAYHLIFAAAGRAIDEARARVGDDTDILETDPTASYAEDLYYAWCYGAPKPPHEAFDNSRRPGRVREILLTDWARRVAETCGAAIPSVHARFSAVPFAHKAPGLP